MSWMISKALMDHYENSRYSPARAAESSAESCSAGEPSAPSSTTPTPQAYLSRDKTTEAWSRFPSGMTCEHLTADRGEELLTSFRAAFPARTSRQRVKAQESTASDRDCGQKWRGSLAKYDRNSRTWKTRQGLLGGGLEEFSETWPRWGTTRGGELYLRKTPSFLLVIRAYATSAKESGSSRQMPTPRASDGEKGGPNQRGSKGDMMLPSAVMRLATPTARDWKSGKASQATMERNSRPLSEQVGGQLNPTWVAWLMGWPIEWTGLEPLEMDRFRLWRRSHGRSLRVAMERILES